MSDQLASRLLPALEIAAFHRAADGSFSSISAVPAWFGRLVSDYTFPFLGHILQEANQFWNAAAPGFQEFGPCADVDEQGREYHYKVIAISTADDQFLLFQRDPATDLLRTVLQKAREQALRTQDGVRANALVQLLQKEGIAAADEIRALVSELERGRVPPEHAEILEAIKVRCDRLRSAGKVTQGG